MTSGVPKLKTIPDNPFKQLPQDSPREIEMSTISNSGNTSASLDNSQHDTNNQSPSNDQVSYFTEENPLSQKKFDFRRAKGLILMMVSSMMTTFMNILIKIQSQTSPVNVIQAIIIRNFFLAIGCYLHMMKDKVKFIDIPSHLWKYVFLRAVCGTISTLGVYIAIDFLPLSLAITVYYVQPIFVTVACFIFLGERLSKIEIFSIFSAMFGVVLLTNPQVIFPSLKDRDENDLLSKGRAGSNYQTGIILSLVGAVAGAFVYVACRKLGSQIHVSIHPFFMSLVCGFSSVWLLASSSYTIGQMTIYDLLMMSTVGLASWIQQECMALALQFEKGGRSAAVNYLAVFNAFLADVVIFGEAIELTDLLGAICIVFFTFLNALMKCFGKTK